MDNDFGIGFGFKNMAIFFKLFFQFLVIFNNPVMYDTNFIGAVGLGMSVYLLGFAVGGPTGVGDAKGGFNVQSTLLLFQLANSPFGFYY